MLKALVFALLAGASLASTGPQGAPGVEQDAWGRPVRDQKGQPLTYSREQSIDLQRAMPVTFEPSRAAASGDLLRETNADAGSAFAMRALWQRHVYGTGIGDAGLHVVDLDGDGQVEIVASSASSGDFWTNDSWILSRRSVSQAGNYELVFRSTPTGGALTALRIAQLDADPALEVVAALGSQVVVYDGATRNVQQVLNTAAEINGLVVADSDGDGSTEFVVCRADAIDIYSLAGALEQSVAAPCQDVAVGQADLDGAPEIVIADGDDPGYVVDGQSYALEWTNPWGFGIRVRLGDVDGDGRAEAVAGAAWSVIRVFDVELHSLKGSIPTSQDITALQLLDVEGDGPLEIVYGDGQWGEVHVHNATTLAQKWEIPVPEHGVTNLALGDPDGDATRELVWGSGYTSSGPDYLYIAETVTHAIEWQSVDIRGPFTALAVVPLVGTSRRAVAAASFESDSGYGDGLYFFHRVLTGAAFYQSPALTGLNWTGMTRLRSAQLDGDVQSELIVASSLTYEGRLICLDTLTHTEQWHADLPSGLSVASLALGDVDGDGALEAVVGVDVQHTGATGVYVFVFDAATGGLEWQSPSLASGFTDLPWLRLAQLDADAQREIVVGATNGQVFVLDRVTGATISLGAQAVTALEAFDLGGDGIDDLFVGTSGGAVRRIHPTTGAVLATPFSESAAVDALAIGDLDGDGSPDYATASANRVRVRSGIGAALLWTSEVLGGPPSTNVGALDSLLLVQVDGLGEPELVVNLGRTGFLVLTSAP